MCLFFPCRLLGLRVLVLAMDSFKDKDLETPLASRLE